jgi:pentatricopeptide repeat protein
MNGTMMDIYVHASKLKEAEAIFKRIQYPDAKKYAIMIQGYGNIHEPDRAMELLRDMLCQDSHVEPNISVITAVMDAFAKSNNPERAREVLQLVADDPKCKQLGIRPNAFTYGVVLKCLARSTSLDAGKSAEALLDEMERRSQAGESDFKPNERSYQLAIQACHMAGDVDRAKVLTERMPKSDIAPLGDETSL